MRRSAVAVLMVLASVGCRIEANPTRSSASQDSRPEAPAAFGFGSEAAAELVRRLDVDVRPDGAGLPTGSASVAQGARVYAAKCAACHGPTGVEGPNDRLAGPIAEGFPFGESPRTRGRRHVGNYWPYATTLFDYINRAMPFDAPGSLTSDEIYGAVAYVLFLNGLIEEDAVVDAATLPAVAMPARDRFVADDRSGGAVIR